MKNVYKLMLGITLCCLALSSSYAFQMKNSVGSDVRFTAHCKYTVDRKKHYSAEETFILKPDGSKSLTDDGGVGDFKHWNTCASGKNFTVDKYVKAHDTSVTVTVFSNDDNIGICRVYLKRGPDTVINVESDKTGTHICTLPNGGASVLPFPH